MDPNLNVPLIHVQFGRQLLVFFSGVLFVLSTGVSNGDIYKYSDSRGRTYFSPEPMTGPQYKLEWKRSTSEVLEQERLKVPDKKSKTDGPEKKPPNKKKAKTKKQSTTPGSGMSEELDWKCFEFEGEDKARCLANLDGPTPTTDFRGFCWGATKDEVRDREDAEFSLEDLDSLIYEVEIAGLAMTLIYQFKSDKLVMGGYVSREKHTNDTDFVHDFTRIKKLLIKKYGNPSEDHTFWKRDLFRDSPKKWGTAVAAGHLIFSAGWHLKRTKILTILKGDNFDITHVVRYESEGNEEAREKAAEEQALEGL